jgi:hypothetical protein
MQVERPISARLGAAFWTGASGMASLEPGLSRLNDFVENALGTVAFHPDGPIADRHGSYERQFLREAEGEVTDILTLALTPTSEKEVDVSVTPGVMRDNVFAIGEAQILRISTASFRSGSPARLTPVLQIVRDLCGDRSLWQMLANRLSEAAEAEAELEQDRSAASESFG